MSEDNGTISDSVSDSDVGAGFGGFSADGDRGFFSNLASAVDDALNSVKALFSDNAETPTFFQPPLMVQPLQPTHHVQVEYYGLNVPSWNKPY